MRKLLFVMCFLVAGLVVGCDGDGDGSGKGGGPKSGQTKISLVLSGGNLGEPQEFEGTFDVSPNLFATSTSILATKLDLKAKNGTAVLQQFIFGPELGQSGTYDAGDAEFSMNVWFPDNDVGYQLHDNAGGGTFTLDRGNDDRATVQIDFDASPSNIGGRDLVFHIKGVIDSRK